MEQSLLKSSQYSQVYNPFQSPFSISKAQAHRAATKVGIDIHSDQTTTCPCCDNIIQKQQLPLACSDEQLLILGVGYPLFYKLTRYILIIILTIFLVSGSGYYVLVTLNCQVNCIYFFGIPIINLQISGEDSAHLTEFIHMIATFAIFATVLYVKTKIGDDVAELEMEVVGAQLFTLMLQNLPESVNDQELNDWCLENLQAKPILINYAYNVTQLANAYTKRQKLTVHLNKIQIRRNHKQSSMDPSNQTLLDCQQQQLQQQITALDNLISLYRSQKIICHKVGTAFLTFSQQEQVHSILSKHENSLPKIFINTMLSPFRSPMLVLRGAHVHVFRAPGPAEVMWQNLGFSFLRTVVAEAVFVLVMGLAILVGFRTQFLVVQFAYTIKQKSQRSGDVIDFIEAIAMSILVIVGNTLLRLMIKLFCYFRKYPSYTAYNTSFCLYYSISYIINTCFMIYIVHNNRKLPPTSSPLQQDNILIYDIHLIMLANAFSQPLYKILDVEMWGRVVWRKYLRGLNPDLNPYTQAYANLAWEGIQISIADNYQYIFRVLVITTWFAHSAPLGVVFSMIGLSIDYWVGKYILLRHTKKPPTTTKQLALPIINSLLILPLVYICGVLQFTYKVSSSLSLVTFITQFLQYSITTLSILLCLLGYTILKKPHPQQVNRTKYQQLQQQFLQNYDTLNPITKWKAQIRYLEQVQRRRRPSQSQENIIKAISDMSVGENQNQKNMDRKRDKAILKVKWRRLRKLKTIDASQEFIELAEFNRKGSSSSDTSKRSDADRVYR